MSAIDAKFRELAASFSGVNWNNPGSWPLVVKMVVWLAAAIVVMLAAYVLFISKVNSVIDVERKKEQSLLKDYEEKAFKAMNLDAYKKQLADMEEAFGALLRQLPKDTEVPSLLEDITHTGIGSGLEFSTIDLKDEQKREFYAELPIEITVRGDYHGFGAFVSGVAALPRIVTLHDFTITSEKSGGKASSRSSGKDSKASLAPRILQMSLTAKTYRYNDASEQTAAASDTGKGKKGKAKKTDEKGGKK